jgi:hypothetical protein
MQAGMTGPQLSDFPVYDGPANDFFGMSIADSHCRPGKRTGYI